MPRAINGERLWAQFCRDYEKTFGEKIDPHIKFKCFEENKEAMGDYQERVKRYLARAQEYIDMDSDPKDVKEALESAMVYIDQAIGKPEKEKYEPRSFELEIK